MTVAELRAALADLDGDVLVVMSKDAEGNNYSPLAKFESEARYVADSEWSGECLHPDDWYDGDDYVKAVCLWPMN